MRNRYRRWKSVRYFNRERGDISGERQLGNINNSLAAPSYTIPQTDHGDVDVDVEASNAVEL